MTDTPTILVAAKVSQRVADDLRAYAKGNGKTVSQVIRDLVEAHLKEYEL